MRRLLDVFLYVISLSLLGVGALGVYGAMANSPTRPADGGASGGKFALPSFATALSPQPFAGRDRISIMLIGSDGGDIAGKADRGRADTLMCLFVNPQTHRAAMLSFPRDLRVAIPGHKTDKINHSYRFGGVPLTRATVDQFLGTKMDYYARCDFKSFHQCADMLGGCDLEVPDVEGKGRGMNYDDNWGNLHIHLRPGYQHLNGEQCMGFVRYRHGDTDINRTQRQQQFLKAMFEQKLRPRELPTLLRAGAFMLRAIDTDMDARTATDLVRVLKQTPSENLFAATVPDKDAMIGGVYYGVPQVDRLQELLTEIEEHLKSDPIKPCSVVVVNSTGKEALGSDAAEMLKLKGFQIARSRQTKGTAKRTQVLYEGRQHATAVRVASILRVAGAEVAPLTKTDDPRAPVQIVLARDFYGTAGPPPAPQAKAAAGVKAKPNPFAPHAKAKPKHPPKEPSADNE